MPSTKPLNTKAQRLSMNGWLNSTAFLNSGDEALLAWRQKHRLSKNSPKCAADSQMGSGNLRTFQRFAASIQEIPQPSAWGSPSGAGLRSESSAKGSRNLSGESGTTD